LLYIQELNLSERIRWKICCARELAGKPRFYGNQSERK